MGKKDQPWYDDAGKERAVVNSCLARPKDTFEAGSRFGRRVKGRCGQELTAALHVPLGGHERVSDESDEPHIARERDHRQNLKA